MPIDFLDLLDDDGWEPVSEGRWSSTDIDASFGLEGIRLAAGVTIPRHTDDQPVLRIVFGGELLVSGDDGEFSVTAGQFVVVDEHTAHALTAGPEGATFTESRYLNAPDPETVWEQ